MKVICVQDNLKNGLQLAGRIVSSTNTLPILNNILLKTEHGQLKIFSTNLEVAITTQVRCKIEEEGEATVLAKTFIELINNIPNTNITLTTQNGEIKIEAENFHTKLKTLPVDDFPLIPKVEKKNQLSIKPEVLKKSLDQVVFACSTNQTQAEILGVYMHSHGGGLRFAATDRYRLAEKQIMGKKDYNQEIHGIIIPQRAANEVSRVLSATKGEDVGIYFSENQIMFETETATIVSRLVDGQYPPYQDIIPQDFQTTATTSKNQLISALRAGSVFAKSSNGVKMVFSPQKQHISLFTENQELGNSLVDLPSEIEGQEGGVVLNYRYILDCLSVIEEDKICIKFNNENSPVVVVPKEDKSYLYLVMPIKN